MSRFATISRRLAAWATIAAFGLGLRAWAQAPAAAATGGWQTVMQVTQGFDSNLFLSPTHPQTAASTNYSLSLGRSWVGPRSSFSVTFAPQGAYYPGHTTMNYLAESYRQAWTYSWPHTTLTWSASGQRMPERAGALGMGATGAGAAANASSPLSLAMVITGGSSSLGLRHQTSPRSSWTASVNAGLRVYTQDLTLLANLLPGSPLQVQSSSRSRSLGGSLGWTHQLTAQRSFSLSASGSQMWYGATGQRLRYTNFQLSLQQGLGANVELSLGGGPAWNQTLGKGAAAASGLPGLGYAATAGLTWQQGQSQYGLSWDRTEQSSYVPGGVTTQMAGLQYNVRWGRSWSTGVSAGYSQYAGVAGGSQNSTYVSSHIDCLLVSGLSLTAAVSYNTQRVPAASGGLVPLNRAHLSLGLSYQPGGMR